MKNKVIAQKELIEFYEHMIRKNSTYLMAHWIRELDTDIMKWEELREKIKSLHDDDWETLEDIIEDIGKRMCHAWLLYPNAWYWNLQDKWWWECKWETLVEVYKEFREELKRNWRYD